MSALLLLDEDAILVTIDLMRAQLAAHLLVLLSELVLLLERLLEDKGGLRTSGFLAQEMIRFLRILAKRQRLHGVAAEVMLGLFGVQGVR